MLRLDRNVVAHKIGADHCPGGGEQAAEDLPLDCWLPAEVMVSGEALWLNAANLVLREAVTSGELAVGVSTLISNDLT